jgi:hypothetical protein
MAKWGDIAPETFIERCLVSFDAALELRLAGDLIAFDIERAASDTEYRERRAFAVKDFLGFGKPRGLRPFLKGWPAINVSRGANAGPLSDAEIADRLSAFEAHPRYRSVAARCTDLRAG